MSSSSSDHAAKLARIEAILAEFIHNHTPTTTLDPEALIERHSELMPELGERLQTLEAIYAAAKTARSMTAAQAGEEAALREEAAFLREALPGYEILALLHRGGQGIVYKAVQKSTERTAALKMPLGGALLSQTQSERFEREVRLIAELSHPNIVTLYEAGIVRGRRYFSMAFVEGVPIDDYVLANGLSVPDTVRLFVKVARAVHHAHTKGVVHRDLKPANVLVDLEGEPRILDFGLAKTLSPETDTDHLSLPGAIIGTLPYLSPEQAAGSTAADLRCDVYALAVVLYELLTGVFPYPVHGPIEEVRRAILETPPLSARRAVAANRQPGDPPRCIGPDLDAILQKTLRKEAEHRYGTAAALADDLERHLRGDLVEARVEAKYYLLLMAFRKYRVAALVVGVVVLALLGSLVGITWAWRHAERAARIAQAGLEMAGHVRLGAVVRDEGRLDQAVSLFENAARIGEALETQDPVINNFLYDAYHRLAQLHRKADRHAEADRYAQKAIRRAETLLQQAPDNAEWQRMAAFANLLRGEMAEVREAWDEATAAYTAALNGFQKLRAQQPENLSTLSALAQTLTRVGICRQKLGRLEEAVDNLNAAYELACALLKREPQVAQRRLACAAAEANLAAWHLQQKTPAADQQARQWLERAETRLGELRRDPKADFHRWEIDQLGSALRTSQDILKKRQAH